MRALPVRKMPQHALTWLALLRSSQASHAASTLRMLQVLLPVLHARLCGDLAADISLLHDASHRPVDAERGGTHTLALSVSLPQPYASDMLLVRPGSTTASGLMQAPAKHEGAGRPSATGSAGVTMLNPHRTSEPAAAAAAAAQMPVSKWHLPSLPICLHEFHGRSAIARSAAALPLNTWCNICQRAGLWPVGASRQTRI